MSALTRTGVATAAPPSAEYVERLLGAPRAGRVIPRLPRTAKTRCVDTDADAAAAPTVKTLQQTDSALHSARPRHDATKLISLAAGPLSRVLNAYALQSGLVLTFEPALTEGMHSAGLYGAYSSLEGLDRLLAGTGLRYKVIGDGVISLEPESQAPVAAADTSETPVETASNSGDEVVADEEIIVEGVRAPAEVGPQRGLYLSRDQIPANMQSISSEEIRESRATSLTELMNARLQSVTINDYAGNPFQADVQFRGFSASPQIGTPQGLSVFLDGIRVNEPFGDVVNWDLIPMNAIHTFDVFPGSNPLFGLNTLGGALSVRTKNGFEDEGVDVSMTGGSWGRIHGQLSAGGHRGALGAYVALNGFHEDGWRDNSPTEVRQAFTKLSLRVAGLEVDLSALLVGNELVGNGVVPLSLYEDDPAAVFTSPDETRNGLRQFSLSGLLNVTDSFNLAGQVYRRTSNRKATGADAYADGFADFSTGSDAVRVVRFPPIDPSTVAQYPDANHDGMADYYSDIVSDGQLLGRRERATINAPISTLTPRQIENLTLIPPLVDGTSPIEYVNKANGLRNGGSSGATQPGVVEGTPIGLINRTEIGQSTEGAAVQLNWNLERHAFMLGLSVDAGHADFVGRQRLGLIDSSHNVFEAPNEISALYRAAREDFVNNRFDGFSNTYSSYFSETFSPWERLHLSLAGRFNYTRVKTNLDSRNRTGVFSLDDFRDESAAHPNAILCSGATLDSCGDTPNYSLRDFNESLQKLINGGTLLDPNEFTPTSEKVRYSSFNPSVGVNFLPTPNSNIFANWSQGSRTPSVIELGCAYDGALVDTFGIPGDGVGLRNEVTGRIVDDSSPDGVPDTPRSLAGEFACTLPSTLSGDPFLPQIEAQSVEVGMRASIRGWQWNASYYRTDLKDDIYLVGIRDGTSFFDTIGDTRRQGLEFGFSGPITGWADLSVNYSLTDATFQSTLFMASEFNNSRRIGGRASVEEANLVTGVDLDESGRPLRALRNMITIEPGARMPGVPLHNVNATLALRPLENLDLVFGLVARSRTYVRGNENNEHMLGQPNPIVNDDNGQVLSARTTTNAGTTPGYVVLSLRANYQLGARVTVFSQVSNLLDKDYFTAGRLGINPFSPSEFGQIGPSGWNYNSRDWLYSTFVAPGAPRAAWVGVEFRF